MPRAPRGRRVPWSSWSEWEDWSRGESLESKHLGACWRLRGRVPLAVEAQDALACADRVEREGHVLAARLARGAAVVRLVNAVADAQRGMAYQQASVAARAGQAGLPRALVDARHEATHASLPSLGASRDAARSAEAWIDAKYVRAQQFALVRSRHAAWEAAWTAWTAVSTRSFQRSLAQWGALVPPPWGHLAAEALLVADGSRPAPPEGSSPSADPPSAAARGGSGEVNSAVNRGEGRSGRVGREEDGDEDDDGMERRWRRVVEAMAKRWPTAMQWTLMMTVEDLARRKEGKASAMDARKVKWLVQNAPMGRRRAEALLRRAVQERIRGQREGSQAHEKGPKKVQECVRERERFLEVLQRACEAATPAAMATAIHAMRACASGKDGSDVKEASRSLSKMKEMDPDVQASAWSRAEGWEGCAIGTLPGSHAMPRFRHQAMGFKRCTETDEHVEEEEGTLEGEVVQEMDPSMEMEPSEGVGDARTCREAQVDVSLVGLL